MNIKNFKKEELDSYWNNGETIFFNYKRVYVLKKCGNGEYAFTEEISLYSKDALPYSKRGRFYEFSKKAANKLLRKEYF